MSEWLKRINEWFYKGEETPNVSKTLISFLLLSFFFLLKLKGNHSWITMIFKLFLIHDISCCDRDIMTFNLVTKTHATVFIF